jgi:hypothetical protein
MGGELFRLRGKILTFPFLSFEWRELQDPWGEGERVDVSQAMAAARERRGAWFWWDKKMRE